MALGSDIEIKNVDQYESLQEILRFLNKRCLVKSAYDCLKQITYQYEDVYGRCERCYEPHEDCYGHDDDPLHDSWYDRFSDEADFE